MILTSGSSTTPTTSAPSPNNKKLMPTISNRQT